ncbi:hypothetical protein ACFYSH_31375 [Streptomyces sp. NPDC005791]|uniref:hypothetical protein n=1 Tax=unclassified Streptomyces TaxID=2593676 RepID=UPI003406DF23
MRSARTLFASAAVTAVLAVSAPAAYAVTSSDDWDKDSGSSASSNDDREKPDSWKHDKPEGGVHAGGGALAGVSADDWEKDKDEDKDEDKDKGKESGSGNNDDREKPDSWKHDKPEGGVHAGGGALAGVSADDWEKDKDEDKDEDKDKGKESGSGNNDDREKPDSWKHDKPEGGVHAGGGALAGVTADDWEKDKESGSGSVWDSEQTWKHEKPEGGVHTGGGALALSGSGLAAGSVLMLGGLGAVAYKLRRRNASGAAAA